MASQAASMRRGSRTTRGRRATAPLGPEPGGPLAWVLAIPPWVRVTLIALVAVLVVGGAGWGMYRALDPLYPQELWRYYRPAAPAPSGTVLYRDLDGQLFLAPLNDLAKARRLLDADAAARGREFVRDAAFLPDRQRVAYFATVRRDGEGEQDRVKVIGLDGRAMADIAVSSVAGEPIRPTVYSSETGRYLAVTNRDRSHVFYYDLTTNGPLTPGTIEAPPERMLWTRNADLRTSFVPSEPAVAASADGRKRAQLRAGRRRAPECEEQRCETTQELVVSSGSSATTTTTATGSPTPQQAATVLYGAFSAFSSEGWGPVPAQPAQRLYGRLVWSPDAAQLLFTTLDGETSNTYAIGTDGRSQPRLVLRDVEALDWIAS